MKSLVLGTAQLGLNYGINNTNGKPLINEAFDILDLAYENDIKILDTASAYGDAEKIIGSYMKERNRRFNIVTKLHKLDSIGSLKEQVCKNFYESLKNLNIDKIEYYLVHSYSDLINNPKIINELENLKSEKKVDNIGVSIYEIEELEYIIENYSDSIDVVQIPFNIFDLRWINTDIIKRAKENNIDIFVRSVYLQGLFFIDKEKADKIHPKCFDYISLVKKLCNLKNCDMMTILLGFLKHFEFLDYTLIGCESKNQLKENISAFKKDIMFTQDDFDFIYKHFRYIEKKIIDPRQWG